MRFIDASVFLYAYLRPKRSIPANISEMKRNAKGILERVNNGEKVATSLVHVSEVANILESVVPLEQSNKIVRDIASTQSIVIYEPHVPDYLAAVDIALEKTVGLNDALAYLMMKNEGIDEIYSFDSHFHNFHDIKRITR